jgi:hypothetical protein
MLAVANDWGLSSLAYLCVFALLDRLLHGLHGVSGELCGNDELAVNILHFLEHVRLELCKCFLERRDALEGGMGCFDGDMGAASSLSCAQWLEDGVDVLDCGQLVVEDVCPGVAPLLG